MYIYIYIYIHTYSICSFTFPFMQDPIQKLRASSVALEEEEQKDSATSRAHLGPGSSSEPDLPLASENGLATHTFMFFKKAG